MFNDIPDRARLVKEFCFKQILEKLRGTDFRFPEAGEVGIRFKRVFKVEEFGGVFAQGKCKGLECLEMWTFVTVFNNRYLIFAHAGVHGQIDLCPSNIFPQFAEVASKCPLIGQIRF